MKIKVLTAHKIQRVISNNVQTFYDYTEEFMFKWEEGFIYIFNWKHPAPTLEDCFKGIKSYFYGTHYDILDFFEMKN